MIASPGKIAADNVSYKIELPAYSGPLDLLLHLIERNELDIVAISLAQVTEQYLVQIEKLNRDRTEHLIDFLVIGARLLLIKSRALLPDLHQDSRNGLEQEEDPAEALARQLREYKRYKITAQMLQLREAMGQKTYLRTSAYPTPERTPDMAGVTLLSLVDALESISQRNESMQESVAVAVDGRRYTIEKQILLLRRRLGSQGRLFFNDLFSDYITWNEVTTTFLAVLELVKRQEVNAYQERPFGPIELTKSG